MPSRNPAKLNGYRKRIDIMDEKILSLLKKRLDLCVKIAEFKKNNGMAIKQPEREREALKKAASKGQLKNMEKAFVESLFRLIYRESRTIQMKKGKSFDRKGKN